MLWHEFAMNHLMAMTRGDADKDYLSQLQKQNSSLFQYGRSLFYGGHVSIREYNGSTARTTMIENGRVVSRGTVDQSTFLGPSNRK